MSHVQQTHWKPTPIDLPPLVRTDRGWIRSWNTPEQTIPLTVRKLDRSRVNLSQAQLNAFALIARVTIVLSLCLIGAALTQ